MSEMRHTESGDWWSDYVRVVRECKALQTQRAELLACLEECREYFDGRADADQPSGAVSPIANEEMVLLMKVEAAIAGARG